MRFFFHLAGAVMDRDLVGHELSGINAARGEASRVLGEYVRDHPSCIWGGRELRVEVTDTNGLMFFAVVMAGLDTPLVRQ